MSYELVSDRQDKLEHLEKEWKSRNGFRKKSGFFQNLGS
jgi:hypothetical protein